MDLYGTEVFSIMLGIGLAAACGLRVFLPLLVASLFSHFNIAGIGLNESFAWMGSWPAMIAFNLR